MARRGRPKGSKSATGPNPVDVHVGKRLRLRRTMLGFSQEKLGEAIGLTFQQVQKYEKGVNRVSAGTLYEIAQVLDLPISWFFDEEVVNRIGISDDSDTAEFSDCMNLLLDLRQSNNLGPVREVLRLAGAR